MKGVTHYINDDLLAIENRYGWFCLDVVDEHWFWLWTDLEACA